MKQRLTYRRLQIVHVLYILKGQELNENETQKIISSDPPDEITDL